MYRHTIVTWKRLTEISFGLHVKHAFKSTSNTFQKEKSVCYVCGLGRQKCLFGNLKETSHIIWESIKENACSFHVKQETLKNRNIFFSLLNKNNTSARGVMRRLILSFCGYYYVNVVCHHNQVIFSNLHFLLCFFLLFFS